MHGTNWQSLGTFWVRGLLLWAVGWLHLLDQVFGCYANTAWSPGLHRGYAWCHQHRHRGDFWGSWCGGDSCGLWLQRCRLCGHDWQRLCQLYRLGGCQLWHRDIESGGSLWYGCHGIWDSVVRFNTAFMWVSSCAVVDSTITGSDLVAVLG